VLALDIHPQRYGYAVLETPSELLDWGVRRRYRKRERLRNKSMREALRSLLGIWRPSIVVLKESVSRKMARARNLYVDLLQEIDCCRVPVYRMTGRDMRNAFSDSRTKYQIASKLGMRFPFLTHLLPPQRKIWRSEDYRMSIFTALALAVAVVSSRFFRHAKILNF
jgi:hypothetical protein